MRSTFGITSTIDITSCTLHMTEQNIKCVDCCHGVIRSEKQRLVTRSRIPPPSVPQPPLWRRQSNTSIPLSNIIV